VRQHFDPHYDFVMIPRVPLDTLDFTSFTMNLGSKMILDATRKTRTGGKNHPATPERIAEQISHIKSIDQRIVDLNLVHDTLLLAKVSGHGMSVLEKLVMHTELAGIKIVASVSEDVDIRDKESYIWGVFTRFDCERDLIFTEQKLMGVSPIYKGIMGIDATWKQGYPKPLTMTDEVKKRVEERWESYWK
jgi:4-hydroxy-3-polyprenylbenzoate decarboxylase